MHADDMNDFEWFDLWCEQHSHLMEEKDYPGLVQCCRQRLDRDPDDLHAMEALAEAYVLNNQHQEAIDMLAPHYKRTPGHPLFAHAILDALLAMGKKVEDFPWTTRPEVLALNGGILDECYAHLKPKRSPRSLFDLRYLFMGRAYLLFSEEDLLQALLSDGRFIVSNQECLPEVSVVRQRRKSQNKPITAQPQP
jgi:hypothetical protein